MKNYIVSLQLNIPENNYVALIAYLKTSTQWARPMNNVWIIQTDKTTAQIRDDIASYINTTQGDKVMVLSLKGGWATHNVSKEVNDWMHGNM